ncbi:flagellar biosynthesis protein FlhB [Anoxynatronum buryatiense]|uniref:Flagellar biosynthetic protein FlhB n=1 Tax=Anoxynatronum buryatiense TaxID=489973 RepID=A0AA45WUJ4_9CLOT|nr:flagellar biosynthesis protein FlhB [Anoxynatronum buryatiense]SMP47344.1 flagellar biosynthetic protein FlhB [Anoxynatronum buryatiense]
MEWSINLQLFAEDEKTEKATPRKRKKAREEGQVLQSREINTSLTLLAAFVLLFLLSSHYGSTMMNVSHYVFDEFMLGDHLFTIKNIQALTLTLIAAILIMTMPLALVVLVIGVTCSFLQVGFLISSKPLQPKLSKLNPIKGLKKLFSLEKVMELFKSLIKIFLIGFVIFRYITSQLGTIFSLMEREIEQSIAIVSQITLNIGLRAGAVLVLLAVLDYYYQKYEHEKKLKMSKQEVKDEHKQVEGDPKIKSKIRQKQMQISMRRMMQEIPKADVVITNPTHYAIAVRYAPEQYAAPVVVAKGQNLVAQNIKKIAEEHGIPMVENRALARVLYDTVEIGDLIPPDLYEAVAGVLAYVYQLDSKQMKEARR